MTVRVFGCLLSSMLCGTFLLSAGNAFSKEINFSRANCVNNESITWEYPWRNEHWWRVYSTHSRGGVNYNDPLEMHVVDSLWSYTWRSAAIHWGEGMNEGWRIWKVTGHHYESISGNIDNPQQPEDSRDMRLLEITNTVNCTLGVVFPYW